jgi:pimeloyl-ACP methyl ester carboxylesterase
MNADGGTQMNAKARLLSGLALGVVAMLGTFAAFAATPVPSGRWSFVFTDQKGRADRPIRVFTYRPKQCDSKCPIMIVLHGAKRDAYPYMREWASVADDHKMILVGPQFEARHWAKAAGYNAGDVKEQPDREKWVFAAIEHIFDEVRDGQNDYALFGHGAGAQVVQRMAIYRPDHRARVMIAANPGWYTMPEWRKEKEKAYKEPYPYSMVDSPAGEAQLRAGLARRMVLIVNEKDEAPDDEASEKRGEVVKQGESRVERAENFIKAANSAAQELGVKLAWEFHEAPDSVKDVYTMGDFAAKTVFGRR